MTISQGDALVYRQTTSLYSLGWGGRGSSRGKIMALTLRRQGQKGENKTHCENQPFERRSTKAKQWNLDIKRVHIACGSRLVKMISKSSSVVTGLSLQTNSTFSGGFMSASGRSPIISSTTAFERAVFSLIFRRRRRYVCICIGNEQKIPLASETAE